MRYSCVIFDLFGTLVDNTSREEYDVMLTRMADVLGVTPKDFIEHWGGTFYDRMVGALQDTGSNILNITDFLGVEVEREHLEEATRIRREFTSRMMVPKPGALETLEEIRKRGLKIGLISDCSSEVPILWEGNPLSPLIDVSVFSCVEGVKKPDARIYLSACERLDVRPEECLYVGDGSSHELTGASYVYMDPVLIRDPREKDPYRIDRDSWEGKEIQSIPEVLELIL